MSEQVDFYFSTLSPWAYIGYGFFHELSLKHGFEITYRPLDIPTTFSQTGWVPMGQRHANRLSYRIYELKRYRVKRGLSFNLKPQFFPFDASLADSVVIALAQRGLDPHHFLSSAFDAMWLQDGNLADVDTVIVCLSSYNLDGKVLISEALSENIRAIRHANGQAAIDSGTIGVPTFVWGGEVFFGQDRLEDLDEALSSGRAPYDLVI